MNRVLILGIDGYIGYALAMELLKGGYEVCGLDNLSRRRLVCQAGSDSLTPIAEFSTRTTYLRGFDNYIDSPATINLSDFYLTERVLREYKPDTIVHLAEQPSAPWSMKGPRQCIDTQVSNIAGTLALLWAMRSQCPEAHLIKLGTMGEYGTPNCDIPEGFIPPNGPNCLIPEDTAILGKCPMHGLPFPRQPGSFYHLSKVHDSYNIEFACKTWDLRSTDIMQGVVFGLNHPDLPQDYPLSLTRFDYDQYFGTAINRFCAQAILGIPLTVYGTGEMVRGFLPLKDSIQCITLLIENPPAFGEYRVVNQFENTYTIEELATEVEIAAVDVGLGVAETVHITNPRTESQKHYYNPSHQTLFDLGYQPSPNIYQEIVNTLKVLKNFKSRINPNCIQPTTKWR